MNKGPKSVAFQTDCETMTDTTANTSAAKLGVTAALFLPNDIIAAPDQIPPHGRIQYFLHRAYLHTLRLRWIM